MEALSCKGVTKQSNKSQFRKGLKGVGNRFIGRFFRVNGFRRYSKIMDLGLAVYRFRVHSNRL